MKISTINWNFLSKIYFVVLFFQKEQEEKKDSFMNDPARYWLPSVLLKVQGETSSSTDALAQGPHARIEGPISGRG